MERERLEKAIRIHSELQKKERFLQSFNSPVEGMNYIAAGIDFNTGGPYEKLTLQGERELSEMIRSYVSKRIEKLEKELAEL